MDLPILVPRSGPVPIDRVPVDDCTLPTADQPLRVAEFDDLFATALRVIERPDSSVRARLVLAGGDDLADRVRRLVDAEATCCSFFTFTLTPLPPDRTDGPALALDIEVPVARADVLAALVRRAGHARRAAE